MTRQEGTRFLVERNILEGAVMAHLYECDADELARMAEVCFGGECGTGNGDEYEFTPDSNYTGVFGEYIDPEPWRKEKYHTLKEARVVARMLMKRTDIDYIRLVQFEHNPDTGMNTILDIHEIQTEFDRDKYPYGSGIDRILKEWCSKSYLFNFEPGVYYGR